MYAILKQMIKEIHQKQLKVHLPVFGSGDTVCIDLLIREGNKKRIQMYQGIVIAYHQDVKNSAIVVRRVFQGVGVERTFFVHSSSICCVMVLRGAKVRRVKLYYIRCLKGKAVRLRDYLLKGLKSSKVKGSYQFRIFLLSLYRESRYKICFADNLFIRHARLEITTFFIGELVVLLRLV
jgi:large subunit ribosomal protein L19